MNLKLLLTLNIGVLLMAGCASKVSFDPKSPGLTTGVSKASTGDPKASASGTDTGSTPPTTHTAPPPPPPPPSASHDECVVDSSHHRDHSKDLDMKPHATIDGVDSDIDADDKDVCETDDHRAGKELGICVVQDNEISPLIAQNPIVIQFLSAVHEEARDVCMSRNACESLINSFLVETKGHINGQHHSCSQGQKFVKLEHHGACHKENAKVILAEEDQIKDAIEKAKLLK